jgi:hypothetical protein
MSSCPHTQTRESQSFSGYERFLVCVACGEEVTEFKNIKFDFIGGIDTKTDIRPQGLDSGMAIALDTSNWNYKPQHNHNEDLLDALRYATQKTPQETEEDVIKFVDYLKDEIDQAWSKVANTLWQDMNKHYSIYAGASTPNEMTFSKISDPEDFPDDDEEDDEDVEYDDEYQSEDKTEGPVVTISPAEWDKVKGIAAWLPTTESTKEFFRCKCNDPGNVFRTCFAPHHRGDKK